VLRTLFGAIAAISLNACAFIYHQPVQQGNVLEQKDIDLLQPGMTKRQVNLIIGTPAIISPFSQDRWDYVFTFRDSRNVVDRKNFTVIFENGALARTEGDFQPGGSGDEPDAAGAEAAIRDVQTDN
jgi:outer membrane protein assembly factor BamE